MRRYIPTVATAGIFALVVLLASCKKETSPEPTPEPPKVEAPCLITPDQVDAVRSGMSEDDVKLILRCPGYPLDSGQNEMRSIEYDTTDGGHLTVIYKNGEAIFTTAYKGEAMRNK